MFPGVSDSYIDLSVTEQATPSTLGTNDINWSENTNLQGSRKANWISVKGVDKILLLVTPVDANVTYSLIGKRGSNDPAPVTIIAPTLITASTTTELGGGGFIDVEKYVAIRVTQLGAATNSKTTASIYGKK